MNAQNEEKNMLKMAQGFLGYSDEEMMAFKSNPRNLEFLTKVPDLMNTQFFFKVVRAHGCASLHKAGQQILINGDGSISPSQNPEKVCIYLLQAISPMLLSAQEFVCAGLDPNHLKFKTAGCFDTGVTCGGLGNVVVEMTSRKIVVE